MPKRVWSGRLTERVSWATIRDGEHVDSLVLEIELAHEPGRFVEVLVSREAAERLVAWVTLPRECGVYFGTGDGAAKCRRPAGHSPISEDGIGHSPDPLT